MNDWATSPANPTSPVGRAIYDQSNGPDGHYAHEGAGYGLLLAMMVATVTTIQLIRILSRRWF